MAATSKRTRTTRSRNGTTVVANLKSCRGADELFRGGVLDPRDRALDQALAAQPRLVSRRGPVIGIENPRPQRPPTEEAR
jgi:hypothetical protein